MSRFRLPWATRPDSQDVGAWADQLVADMRSGYLPCYHTLIYNRYITPAGINERNDHQGYVSYLKSDEFRSILAKMDEAAAIDGIESLTLA